jgi:uncharacterized membrane protein YhaH (DUF805 family)
MNDLGFVTVEAYEPKFFALSGRIGRVRYLAFSTIMMAVFVGLFLLAGTASIVMAPLGIVLMVAAYLPMLVMSFVLARRRFNDLDQSGWLSILMLIPLVNVLIGLWLLFGRGSEQANRFGPPPSPNTTAMVVLAWCFIIIPAFFGIAAAIAIPAYQGYVLKSKAAQAAQDARAVQSEPAAQ